MTRPQHATADLFRQLLSDVDIPAPEKVLSRLSQDRAANRLESAPYSLLTNLAHAVHWQEIWLAQLQGRPSGRNGWMDDWTVPSAEEYKQLRDLFIQGAETCLTIAETEPFAHAAESDDRAIHLLNSIAIHNAYHVGQMKLLKRML